MFRLLLDFSWACGKDVQASMVGFDYGSGLGYFAVVLESRTFATLIHASISVLILPVICQL